MYLKDKQSYFIHFLIKAHPNYHNYHNYHNLSAFNTLYHRTKTLCKFLFVTSKEIAIKQQQGYKKKLHF